MIGLVAHASAMSRLLAEINMERLQELQRFAEVGRVSAGLIHDMTSPLTAAILHLERDGPRELSSIRHARRSIRVLERYIEAARQQLCQQDNPTVFCAKREVYQAKYILQPLARRRHTDLRFSVRVNGCNLLGDPVKFQRIIINLVTNAMDACHEGAAPGKQFVRLIAVVNRQQLIIRVRDHGKGISDEQLPRLFKPFYTTKQPGGASGIGIGLSTVKQYVEEDFNGTITATSCPDKGTEFRVGIPLCPSDSMSQ
jgi:signal transduction histidine kinase